jgi:hypothetical protein
MIPNSLDEIILRVSEPTIKASIELSKMPNDPKYEPLKEMILNKYREEIKKIINEFKLSADDLSQVYPMLIDDLLWYCHTKLDVKCSDKKIDEKYKASGKLRYLSPNELQNYLAFKVIGGRWYELNDLKNDNPKAEEILEKYNVILNLRYKNPTLGDILYPQIGQLIVKILKEKGILIQKEECGEYVILTDHPEVQDVMKKFHKY